MGDELSFGGVWGGLFMSIANFLLSSLKEIRLKRYRILGFKNILIRKFLYRKKFSDPISKAEDPRKRKIYEDLDMNHYQRIIISN